MKATAIAPANIALIKYWGKKDEELRLPLNSSISMNLSNCLTTTTVEFSEKYKEDEIIFLTSVILGSEATPESDSGQVFRPRAQDREARMTDKKEQRVTKHLDRIRKLAKIALKAKVITQNSFPSSAGIASSASGFAALTVAGCMVAGIQLSSVILGSEATPESDSGQVFRPRAQNREARMTKKTMSEKELTILARIGSGSACRSIPDGFVEWVAGDTNESSYAYSLYDENYWDLRDIILIVSSTDKKIGSTKGMENVWSSPLMEQRFKTQDVRLKKIKTALADKNFTLLGETMEEECLNIHSVMQSQKPPLYYWQPETIKVMAAVKNWRSSGLPVYFTIDAGPNVHLICEGKGEKEVLEKVKMIKRIEQIIINKPALGTRLSEKHLF